MDIISQIRRKEQKIPVCPHRDLVELHLESLRRIESQFYNPEANYALTCLIRTALNGFTPQAKSGAEIQDRIARIFGARNSLEGISVRVPTSNPEQLVNEAYIGIVYLNDLRGVTSSFKYIYGLVLCSESCDIPGPHLIEETLEDYPPVSTYLSKLPISPLGSNKFRSLVFQLISALGYASKQGLSNFPLQIRIRPVPENSSVPIYLEDRMVYLQTYGALPVFTRFHTVGFQVKSLGQEQAELYNFLYTNLPLELQMLIPRSIHQIGYSDLLGTVQTALTCSARYGVCNTLSEMVQAPKVSESRVRTYVRSLITRIDEIVLILETSSANDPGIYLTWPVLYKYLEILTNIRDNYPSSVPIFSSQRSNKSDIVRSKLRTVSPPCEGKCDLRGDLEFIDLVKNLKPGPGKVSSDQVKVLLDSAVSVGDRLVSPLPNFDLNTGDGFHAGIIQIRNLIRNQTYFETTNGAIDYYRKTVGPYPKDFTSEVGQVRNQKDLLTDKFKALPLNFQIRSVNDAVLVTLYSLLINPIDSETELRLNTYLNSLPETQSYNDVLYLETILASDPVPLFRRHLSQ